MNNRVQVGLIKLAAALINANVCNDQDEIEFNFENDEAHLIDVQTEQIIATADYN